jgi:8-oxo-dGTP diphosphatase
MLQKNPTMTVVAVALVDAEVRVLLQQRAPERSMAGLWDFRGRWKWTNCRRPGP